MLVLSHSLVISASRWIIQRLHFIGFFLVSFWFLFFFSNKKTSPRVLSLDKVSIAFWVPFFCFSSVFLWSSSLPFYPLLPKLIRKIMPKESAEKQVRYSNSWAERFIWLFCGTHLYVLFFIFISFCIFVYLV